MMIFGVAEARHKFLNSKLVWADALDWADCAAEHVIGASKLASALDGLNVFAFFDDADGCSGASRVTANVALHVFGYVAANFAETYALFDLK
jgi:hypothetical protein